jgi:hypothetical protein
MLNVLVETKTLVRMQIGGELIGSNNESWRKLRNQLRSMEHSRMNHAYIASLACLIGDENPVCSAIMSKKVR